MRIILINPPTYNKYPQPPLGLLSLATVLKAKDHGVNILDANTNGYSYDKIIQEVELVDAVGITATSLSYPEAEKIARAIRESYRSKFMVIGGIHATLRAKEILDVGIFNAVISGEGDKTFPLAIELQEEGIYHQPTPVNMDDLPMLDYDLLGKFRPKVPHGKHQTFMPMITSRGCPFRCSFCSKAVFGNKLRIRDMDLIVEEIAILHRQFGIKEVKFYDDVFTLDKDHAVGLSQRIAHRVDWSCMTRVNLVDKFTLNQMKRGGCYSIAFGLESGNQAVLKGINKNTTIEQAEEAVRYAKEVGMRVIGYFMLGAPGETWETIFQTIDWAIKLELDHAQFSIATALPGSELYELVSKELRSNCYALPGMKVPSLCALLPPELEKAQQMANKIFKNG